MFPNPKEPVYVMIAWDVTSRDLFRQKLCDDLLSIMHHRDTLSPLFTEHASYVMSSVKQKH